ncbi:SPOR domain-containing protein [Acidocella sp.]|uniref:SPOR domain-containing protein n=1 Tax=Acidocella sp. TaxID=50710 RepID=UPI0026136A2E|nr:SPOR domain-containing protein [Acidocella sp.]MDD2794481.1 SPOR domain-containing protein [Acidocella sp.]
MSDPGDDEFIYQTHRPGQPMDQAVRKMVLGAGGVSVLLILVALLWGGVRATGFGPPPVIGPPPGPLRVAPLDPGGLTVPGADQQIMSGDASGAPPQLAPATPPPDVAQLDQAAGINQPPPSPAPTPASPPASTPSVPTPTATPASTPAPAGPAQVQLAATADEAGAQSVWDGLKRKMPDVLAGKSPVILPAVVNGKSVWRLRVDGFSTPAAAQAFCTAVAAKGAACTVAPF